MKIFVKNLTGKTLVFEVNPEDTIEHLKQMIQDYDGVPANQLRIIFSGKTLKNECCINDYNIQNESTLHLNMELLGGCKSYNKNLIIETTDHHTIKVNVEYYDTIYYLKGKIEKELNVPIFRQCLTFNGQTLNNNSAICCYEFLENSVLHLSINPIQIVIKNSNGYTTNLTVNPFEYVRNIKAMIQKKGLGHIDQQKLSFNGVELQDDNTIDFYQIIGNDIIDLQVITKYRDIQIFVKSLSEKTYIIEANPNEKIENVIKKIEIKMNIVFDEYYMYLTYISKQLEKGYTVADYNIQDGSTIFINGRIRGGY